jgi:hypothetical protein
MPKALDIFGRSVVLIASGTVDSRRHADVERRDDQVTILNSLTVKISDSPPAESVFRWPRRPPDRANELRCP